MRNTVGQAARVIRTEVGVGGLVGSLYAPSGSKGRPAVILLGGSDGGVPEGGASALAARGFAALSLAYFGPRPLRRELVEVPLEYFASAIRWLRERPEAGPGRVALVGGSKGGEAALLLGATYPEEVGAVVGYVPSGVVYGVVSLDPWAPVLPRRSSWTLGGRLVPFVDARPRPSDFLEWRALPSPAWPFFAPWPLPRYPVALSPAFERPLDGNGRALAAASIPVERIEGPVLLLSGGDDRLWPSARLSEMVVERLRKNGHPYPYRHLLYEEAGHGITPPRSGTNPLPGFLDLGGTPEADRFASADAWPRVLGFLGEHLE